MTVEHQEVVNVACRLRAWAKDLQTGCRITGADQDMFEAADLLLALWEEGSKLSAGHCIFQGYPKLGEGGNPYCKVHEMEESS